jgi:hypothetical protein
MAEDRALALAVTREVGIDDAVAMRAFGRAPLDPGTVRHGTLEAPGGDSTWTDATAANDPESLGLLLRPVGGVPRIVVYNHRDDRVPRLVTFADCSEELRRAERLVVTGDRPPWTVRRKLARVAGPNGVQFVPAAALAAWIRTHAPGRHLAFCGNTRGLDVPRLIEEAAPRD